MENKIVITCDGPLDVEYEKNVATFRNNVKVDRGDNQIYCDRLDVYFIMKKDALPAPTADASNLMGGKIDKIVAKGNVKIVRGENVSYSEEATYSALDKKIILSGRPKLVIYSKEEVNPGTQ